MKSILTLLALAFLIKGNAQNNPIANTSNGSYVSDPQIIPAHFPGGIDEWVKYVQTTLHSSVAADNIVLKKRQKDSAQTVTVSFFVDTTGSIMEVKVENPNRVHPKVASEIIRVIANGPK